MIAVKRPDDAAEALRRVTAPLGHPESFPGFVTWEPLRVEVGSGGPIDVGIDGEALRMASPLRFTIRPGALRTRLPRAKIRLSPQDRPLPVKFRGLRCFPSDSQSGSS